MKKKRNKKLHINNKSKKIHLETEEGWTLWGIITVIIAIIGLIIIVLYGIPHYDYYPGEPKVPPFR